MADKFLSLEKVKEVWHTQVHDEQNWALNKKLLRAFGLFVGSIIVFRNFGDQMARIFHQATMMPMISSRLSPVI
ncbi:Mitochondrial import receptor subunit TOM5-like protein [Drosera capensis]